MGSTELSRGPFCIAIENPDREKIMLATENGVDGVMAKLLPLYFTKDKSSIQDLSESFNPELLYDLAKKNLKVI